jgi:hypothetical protein
MSPRGFVFALASFLRTCAVVATRRSAKARTVSTTVTIIVTPLDDEEAFESMSLDERRRNGHEWEEFSLGSGRLLETFFMKATHSDLTVIACEDRERAEGWVGTRVIVKDVVVDIIPDLEELLDKNAEATARALLEHADGDSDLRRVSAALSVGIWPDNGDPAEESAAFAHLLEHAVLARDAGMGVCWEYRGNVSTGRAGP